MIHYHGIPFSGGKNTHMSLSAKHAFISFAHRSSTELVAEMCQSFALDNGAYSYWKTGKDFDMEGFAGWVNDWYRHPGFDFYCIPDSIGGDHNDNHRMRAKWRNHCSTGMWERGYPVWHLHEPLEILRDLIQSYPGVALGSSGEFSVVGSNAWWRRMSEAMDVATDDLGRPIKPLHGLRMLNPTIFSRLPLKSADSTNVARNAGMDVAWKGTYAPKSAYTRALIMMERIESHASSNCWEGTQDNSQNLSLFG
jgi:hypothetical protein